MAGKPIATVGSMHICPMCSGSVPHVGGPILGPGAPNVLFNKKPAALMGDLCACIGPPDTIVQGHPFVRIEGVPVAFLSSLCAHGGGVSGGELNITLSSAVPTPPITMGRERISFPKITLIDKIRASIVGHSLKEAETNIDALKKLAPETPVEEDSKEVTLQSTFPMDQLQLLAQRSTLDNFLIYLMDTFGYDIPSKAYQDLYTDALKNAAVLTPTLLVKPTIPHAGKATFYNNQKVQEIWIGEQFIRDAAGDNDTCGELLVVLIEEYGHYLDYLLRNHYTVAEQRDALRDEGAYFSYRLLQLNNVDTADQYYADTTIDGVITKLTWDYEPFHKAIKEFVNEDRWHKDDHFGAFEMYKAGFLKEKEGQYSHGNIEQNGLSNSMTSSGLDILFSLENDQKRINNYLLNIYFGNWKRDYSQGLDPLILRVVSNTLAMLVEEGNEVMDTKSLPGVFERFSMDRIMGRTMAEDDEVTLDLNKFGIPFVNFDTITFKPVDKAVKVIATILEMLAVKEFVHKPIEDAEKDCNFKFLPEQIATAEKNNKGSYIFPDHLKKETHGKSVLNYKEYLNLLKYNFSPVDKQHMGVYVPAEHIDNPTGLGMDPNNNDKNMLKGFMGNDLGIDDKDDIHGINMEFGMKNYIRNSTSINFPKGENLTRFKNSHTYILYKLFGACKSGGHSDPKCKDDLGAALHTLEDFFAHSNYAEIALIKEGAYGVFPWVTAVEGKIDYMRYITDPVEKHTVDTNRSYDILHRELFVDINDSNRLATKIPLVTGTFGPLDTVASILPIIAHVFDVEAYQVKAEKTKKEEKEYKEENGHYYYKDKINMTSFNDILVLELLRDLTNPDKGPGDDEVEDSKFVKTFLSLLHARDMTYTALDKTSRKGHDVYESLPGFAQEFLDSIVDTVGSAKDWAAEGIGSMIEEVKLPIYKFFYTFLQFAATNINDVQSLMNIELKKLDGKKDMLNLSIGLNPTHTQVAKDDPHHPMHTLSAQLAIKAVERVGSAVFKVWQGPPDAGNFETVAKELNSLMLHPAASNWQTPVVTKWMRGTSKQKQDNGVVVTVTNNELMCRASTPTTAVDRIAHTNDEIEETIKMLKDISSSPQFRRFNKASDTIVANIKEHDPASFDKIKDTYKRATTATKEQVATVQEENKETIGYFEKNLRDIEATILHQRSELIRIREVWEDTFPLPLYCTMTGVPVLYLVKKGDTLSGLAEKGNTNVQDLLQLNPIIDPETKEIFAGHYIKVPNPIFSDLKNGALD